MILNELKPGKFKGISFLIRSSNITGGRKDIKHEFPNSSKQTIEDLGLLPRTINLSIYISAPNYFQKRDSLLRAFEESTSGILSHPFYGDLPNYKARTYSLTEDLTDLGEARFDVTFDLDNDDGLPKVNLDVIGNIESTRQLLSNSILDNISNNFKVTNKFQNNFREARLKLLSLNNTIREKTNFVFKIKDTANEFNALLADFGNFVNELITTPANLANTIISIFDNIDALYTNAKDSFDVYKSFNRFGNNDIKLNVTTTGLDQRQKNNDVINSSVKALSLGYQYQNASKLSFNTVEEIELVESIIEDNYQDVINSEGITEESISIAKDLRSLTSRFFKNEKLNVDRIVDVSTNLTSTRLLSYQYYADSSRGEQIANLNFINDITFIEGNLKVFTE